MNTVILTIKVLGKLATGVATRKGGRKMNIVNLFTILGVIIALVAMLLTRKWESDRVVFYLLTLPAMLVGGTLGHMIGKYI